MIEMTCSKCKKKFKRKRCEDCAKKYREEHKDAISKSSKKYFDNNKDKIQETQKKYKANNKGKRKKSIKKYYDNNREKIKESTKKRYPRIRELTRLRRDRNKIHPPTKQNPEGVKEYRLKNKERVNVRSRIQRMIREGELIKPEKCPLCNFKTKSHKIWINLNDDHEFLGFICSFCHGEKQIQKNIKKGLT